MDSVDSRDEEAPLIMDNLQSPTPKNHTRDVHILSSAFLLIFLAHGAAQNLETTVNALYLWWLVLWVQRMLWFWGQVVIALLVVHSSKFEAIMVYHGTSFFVSWFCCLNNMGCHARDFNSHEGTVIGKFNGEFWGTFALHQFVGNLMSLALLRDGEDGSTRGTTLLFVVFLCSMTLGTILMCFLGKTDSKEEKGPVDSSVVSVLKSVITALCDKQMQLIVPLIAYSGLQQAFVLTHQSTLELAEFTNYVVKPALGESGVGGAMAVYGAFDASMLGSSNKKPLLSGGGAKSGGSVSGGGWDSWDNDDSFRSSTDLRRNQSASDFRGGSNGGGMGGVPVRLQSTEDIYMRSQLEVSAGNNKSFFARKIQENELRPEGIPPSQGGKYVRFGSSPVPSQGNNREMCSLLCLRGLESYPWLLHLLHNLQLVLSKWAQGRFLLRFCSGLRSEKVKEGGYDYKVNETVNVVTAKTTETGQKTWRIMKGVMALASQKVEEYTKDGMNWKNDNWQPENEKNGIIKSSINRRIIEDGILRLGGNPLPVGITNNSYGLSSWDDWDTEDNRKEDTKKGSGNYTSSGNSNSYGSSSWDDWDTKDNRKEDINKGSGAMPLVMTITTLMAQVHGTTGTLKKIEREILKWELSWDDWDTKDKRKEDINKGSGAMLLVMRITTLMAQVHGTTGTLKKIEREILKWELFPKQ
ncbi:hypothetical protein SLEP1_g38900 [Rubroshorea leprosula]|uniref:Uncharacterized protein n=1 Tax=Rubroshorea leprosula TaxID=152421 RepID=A0AAV5KYS3_9ROSI|nr:hypothetical protein SLEP1_g38900 [Rubroshorea leprosula]